MARPVGVSVSSASVTKIRTTLFQVVEHGYQVAQAAAQPVELPHGERVAVFQFLQATEQDRALRRGSR
jgi:hypothetical protein